ncbi:hypothetical protein N8224_03095 [Gammaproteobacteria bacterium]|nr:hypothetical protein [Gammaproteobacteria bacterium]
MDRHLLNTIALNSCSSLDRLFFEFTAPMPPPIIANGHATEARTMPPVPATTAAPAATVPPPSSPPLIADLLASSE